MRRVLTALALLAATAWAAPAHAGSFTFSTLGEFATIGPVSVDTDLTLTVRPWSSGGNSSNWRIDVTGNGAGVDNGVCVVIVCDSGEMDGLFLLDGLQFTFSKPVALTQIDFSNWDSNDEAWLFTGSVFGSMSFVGRFDTDPLNLAGITSNEFFLGAFEANDNFRVKSLTFEPVAASARVPEPMSLMLLGAGLAGAGARRLRLRRQTPDGVGAPVA